MGKKVEPQPSVEKTGSDNAAPAGESNWELMKKIFSVLKPYFSKQNARRKKAIAWCVLMLVLMCLETWVLVQISNNQRSFSTAMSEKNAEGFYAGVQKYIFILVLAAPLFAFSTFARGRLALDWRIWLTHYFSQQYFTDKAFYHLQFSDGDGATKTGRVDNPDQRIAADIESFTSTCVDLIILFGGKVFRVATFLGVLYAISPELVVFCLAYSAFGTGVTVLLFGHRLRQLRQGQLQTEADFRFSLVRTREHAEEIAFYHGGVAEMNAALTFFDQLVAVAKRQLRWDSWLKGFQNGYSWVTFVLPYLLVAHRYFDGSLEFGAISQTSYAFQVVQGGLSFIVQNARALSSLAAETDRLFTLRARLEAFHRDRRLYHQPEDRRRALATNDDLQLEELLAESAADDAAPLLGGEGGAGAAAAAEESAGLRHRRPSGGHDHHRGEAAEEEGLLVGRPEGGAAPRRLPSFVAVETFAPGYGAAAAGGAAAAPAPVMEVEGLTLLTPDRSKVICRDLSFTLHEGQSLLLFAPSGAGKSSLLRAFAGLWNAGRGRVRRPPDDQVFFVPQKPYMPVGTLADQVAYPRGVYGEGEEEGGEGAAAAAAAEVLSKVQLAHVLARLAGEGGLAATRPWEHELSVGEQQRLAAARVLYRRPTLAYLDESTSGLDRANEAALYAALRGDGEGGGGGGGCRAHVSIGHRPTLFEFHTHVLTLVNEDEAKWEVMPTKQFIKQHRLI